MPAIKKPIDPTLRINNLRRRHQLSRIELIVSSSGVWAIAYPEPYHPCVAQRREEAIAAKLAEGTTSLSLKESEKLISEALRNRLVDGHAEVIDAALDALESKLKAIAL